MLRYSQLSSLTLIYLLQFNLIKCNLQSLSSPMKVSKNTTSFTNTSDALQPSNIYVRNLWIKGHLLSHPELCPEKGRRLRLLIMIISRPENSASRDAIRHTWGHQYPGVSLIFVIGKPKEVFKEALGHEDFLYGDLIIGRNLDSYSNLSLKTLSILEWINKNCPLVSFILKTDDDVFINMPRLLDFVYDLFRLKPKRTIWGKLLRNCKPHRKQTSKYYVSMEQFPGMVYPDFVTGPAYLMTADCVKPLLSSAVESHMKYLGLEDVFVTGILAQKAGLVRKHAKEFHNKQCLAHPCIIRRYITVHNIRAYNHFNFWSKLFDSKFTCNDTISLNGKNIDKMYGIIQNDTEIENNEVL